MALNNPPDLHQTQPLSLYPDVTIRSSNASRSNRDNPNHPQYMQRLEQPTPGPTGLQATTPNAPPAIQKSSSAPSSDGLAYVTFWLQYQAEFGQCIRIVGSTDSLGTWTLRGAPEMKWGQGHKWSVTVEVPAGAIVEYKYVVLQSDGVNALHWQQGNNAVLAVMVRVPSWNCLCERGDVLDDTCTSACVMVALRVLLESAGLEGSGDGIARVWCR